MACNEELFSNDAGGNSLPMRRSLGTIFMQAMPEKLNVPLPRSASGIDRRLLIESSPTLRCGMEKLLLQHSFNMRTCT